MADLPKETATFEKVWAALIENAERQKETAMQMKETDRLIQENAERQKETDRQMKETGRQMKETDRRIGDLGNRLGELAEHLVLPGIVEKFNRLGFHFPDASQPRKIFDTETGRLLAEVDILLENGDIVIAVEVKTKLRNKDVDDHLSRMDFLRRMADTRNDKRKFRGAMATAILKGETRDYALEAGFYVIEQSGDTMKLDIPEGFFPREW